MSTVAVLTQARSLISDPAKFATGALARDCDGNPVEPGSDNACRWCAMGAVYKFVIYTDSNSAPLTQVCTTSFILFGTSPMTVNDCLGHSTVIDLFDHAILDARADETAS